MQQSLEYSGVSKLGAGSVNFMVLVIPSEFRSNTDPRLIIKNPLQTSVYPYIFKTIDSGREFAIPKGEPILLLSFDVI